MSSPFTFGLFLRQMRKRAGMTQGDLAAAVGYSLSFICDLEKNRRLPVIELVVQRFVPALGLQEEISFATQLVELAALARGERPPSSVTLQHTTQVVVSETFTFQSSRLPAPPTELIGRDQEIEMLCLRLQGHSGRLLTLIGPPGVGKTRLGLAVAIQSEHLYQDGSYFIPLAALSDPSLVAAELVATLPISDMSQRPPKVKLIEFLRRKQLLLVLDNFEQINAAAGLVAELLAECSGLHILVTSRERLHLRAEQRYQVRPLLLDSAVALFIQRAQAVDFSFEPTAEQQPIIEAICQRLDRLPLAIELIAARCELFSPHVILARLTDHSLDLLNDGPDDAPAHQRTLRNAIHRSYMLCNPEEQRLLRTLGVFIGGFDLPAVMHFSFSEVTLHALVNKSLVKAENHAGSDLRFLLLETIREYAGEKLSAAHELAIVGEKHANYFLNLTEEAATHFDGRADKRWQERLTCDHGNLYLALGWLLRSNVQAAQQMTSHLYGFWLASGRISEGRNWFLKTLAASSTPTLVRAWALWAAADLAENQADHLSSQQLVNEALNIFQAQDDLTGCAKTLNLLGYIMVNIAQFPQSVFYFEQSLVLARQTESRHLTADALVGLGHVSTMLDRPPAYILPLLRESADLYRTLGHLEGVAYSLDVEARTHIMAGDYAQAVTRGNEALAILQVLGSQVSMAWILNHLGKATWLMGDRLTACTHWREALPLFQQAGIESGLREVCHYLGQVEP